tara:strand:- start:805 stop:1647 length:843 start_codon:yes stop_codon:yes gene_type:complete
LEGTNLNNSDLIEIFKKASLCRNFEEKVYELINLKKFKMPIYLSAGQEFISSTIAHVLKNRDPLLFAQHRAHSTYLSFDGDIGKLIDELLGRETGCSYGMGGSASIQEQNINMFGHDGLMGSQVPIAVGACLSTGRDTISFMGDASAEEDYVMSSIAWAGFKNLPITFIVEDNNLSILTEKKARRNWEMDDFAKSVGLEAVNIQDDPKDIYEALNKTKTPRLLNINTDRLFWHAGAGQDDYERVDRYAIIKEKLGTQGEQIDLKTKKYLKWTWESHLEKQ